MDLSKITWLKGTTGAWLLVAAFGCSGNASLGSAADSGVGGFTQSGSGGGANTGGRLSTGGDCGLIECFRAYECVEHCGGPIVSSGCCPCGDGTIDRVTACVGVGGNSSIGGSSSIGSTAIAGNTATAGATGAPYSPCGGKKCGDICTMCPPDSTTCVETNMLKACDSQGTCMGSSLVQCDASGGAPATGGTSSTRATGGSPSTGGASSPNTSTYQPCGGKKCGESCTLCPPNSTNCSETADVKTCDLAGQCMSGTQQCTTTTGGSTGAGGSTGIGGRTGVGGYTYDCDPMMECFHANVCVEYCGGPVIGTGCCQCPTGTFDQSTSCSSGTGGAHSTGGAPATGGTTSATQCGAAVCAANEECCNPSCSQCVPKGGGCIAMVCTTGGSSSIGGATSTGTGTGITGLHDSCTNRTCAEGLTPVKYYGIAGTSGPLFCSCEIPCSTSSTAQTCPNGLMCTYVADGPGNVCY